MLWRLMLAIALVACKDPAPSPPPPPRDADLAWHRVALFGADGSEVAFLAGLPRGSDPRAVVISGHDRSIGRVARIGARLRVEFPIYLTALVLDPAPDGGYTGNYEIASPAWGTGSMPLRAKPVAGPTLSAQATVTAGPPLDLGEPRTVWRMALGDMHAKLVLDQRAPGEHEGAMFFDNGNVAYFGGTARGDRLLLAGFEGASPFSLDLVFDAARASAKGTWRAGHLLGWKEAITGTRTPDYELATKIAIDGERPALRHPQLRDFDGKPVIVELAATWCATCKVIAPTLRELSRQYKGDGLVVVSLLYELTRDPAANQRAEKLFRDAHGATWPVRAVPGEQEDLIDVMPEGLTNVDVGGFPVVVFRRRDGTIAGVHSGFPAPATGGPHQATVAKFRRLTAEIVRSH